MSKRGRLQTNVEYVTVFFLLSGLGLLPRRLAIRIGCAMGQIAYWFTRELKEVGERNLKVAFPESSDIERKRILQGCFINLGRQLGEFSHFSKIRPDTLDEVLDSEGLERLREALASGHGVLLFTGHLGGWELSSFALSVLGYPGTILVRRIDNPKIERLVDQIRTCCGIRTIDKRAAIRSMLRALSENRVLGLLVDINMMAHEGIFVDFFGTPASTTSMLARLGLRTEAPIMPVFVPWIEQRQRFMLYVGAPLDIERSGDEEKDVRRLTSQITEIIESYIRRYPDQWLWIHKRWQTRPEGEPSFYETPR
jgi:KDO2-lipid IV(A) lauroyltransferase